MNQQPEFQRNLGFFSVEEQEKIANSTVAIAGAGGDGGLLAIQLARLGVGEIRLADPENFEIENINRQAACTSETIGQNKARAVGEYVLSINPAAEVLIREEGITPENTEEFVQGADLVIDETEFTYHHLGVMFARAARQENIPNLMVMNVGFGASVTSFDPKGKTFEAMLGLSEEDSIEEISQQNVDLKKWLPYIPDYVDIEMFKKVAEGHISAPTVAPGVAVAAGIGATEAVLHLLGEDNNRPKPTFAPRSRVIDVMNGTSKTVKHPSLSHEISKVRVFINNKLDRVPKT